MSCVQLFRVRRTTIPCTEKLYFWENDYFGTNLPYSRYKFFMTTFSWKHIFHKQNFHAWNNFSKHIFRMKCLILFESYSLRPLWPSIYSITSTFHPQIPVARGHRSIILFQAYPSSSSDMLSFPCQQNANIMGFLVKLTHNWLAEIFSPL